MKPCCFRGSFWVVWVVLFGLARPAPGQPTAPGRLLITGQVVDKKDSAIPGATVSLAGTAGGASTDAQGGFKLLVADSLVQKLPPGPVSLNLFFVGYQPLRLVVMENRPMLVKGQTLEVPMGKLTLAEDSTDLTQVVTIGYSTHISSVVPNLAWPPPQPSTRCPLPAPFLVGAKRLRDVDARLSASLQRAGYSYRAYYSIPEGFALVTQLEQTDDQATPRPEPERWSEAMPHARNLLEWLKNALFANKGHYRVIVFTVTPTPFVTADERMPKKVATDWLKKGLSELPATIGRRRFTADCVVTVLVYEFLQEEDGKPAHLVDPSLFSGLTHLAKAGIVP
ncbi:carboxypeptidase-like regulatory domain-containing protein [Hymenobacter terricola]|uniref:carboxypeptidase-like regulatory domain-containing protein n=1 Tax=Hymenobacter terricola TaxID=2819236 RepID=UPI001B3153FC|nr:carboxypeptidase-like regulatory domain-containing protein [Hymenobacter terricola]